MSLADISDILRVPAPSPRLVHREGRPLPYCSYCGSMVEGIRCDSCAAPLTRDSNVGQVVLPDPSNRVTR